MSEKTGVKLVIHVDLMDGSSFTFTEEDKIYSPAGLPMSMTEIPNVLVSGSGFFDFETRYEKKEEEWGEVVDRPARARIYARGVMHCGIIEEPIAET